MVEIPGRGKATKFSMEAFTEAGYARSVDHVQSPFRYPGGKFYALKFILPLLHAIPHDEYREPFVGGGSVFFGKLKAEFSILNDLENDVIETYRAIKSPTRCARLVARVRNETANRERHREIRDFVPKTKDEIAFRTYYLNRTSYSGIIHKPAWGYAVGSSSPPENWPRFLEGALPKLRDVELTSVDFSEIVSRPMDGRRVLMYLDPPYFLADQKRAYTKPFVLNDHIRLEKELRNLDCPFVLSYDDCKEVRDLYSWAHIYPRQWFHNTANSSGPRKVGQELLISNVLFRQGLFE
jgi:DNA adenine methylase